MIWTNNGNIGQTPDELFLYQENGMQKAGLNTDEPPIFLFSLAL